MTKLTQTEKNKLIERTSKYEAYQAVYLWIQGGKENFDPSKDDAAWYAKEKMDGHLTYLQEHSCRYENGKFIKNDGYYNREAPIPDECTRCGLKWSEDHAKVCGTRENYDAMMVQVQELIRLDPKEGTMSALKLQKLAGACEAYEKIHWPIGDGKKNVLGVLLEGTKP